MSWWEGLILGTVQGLTEFLPVSSSAHLVLGESLLGVRMPGVVFEASVHLATLAAVLWAYRRRIVTLAAGVTRGDPSAWRYVGLLALATLPAATAGLLARSALEATYEEPLVAAALLLVTGVLVYTVRGATAGRGAARPGPLVALLVGAAQALAILPGISRSGATVATGIWQGVEPARMAEFSFLMSVPAIAGAAALQLPELADTASRPDVTALFVGCVAAAVVGVLAIRAFVDMLKRERFHWFAYYCWIVGIGYLAAAWMWPGLRG